MCIYLQQRGRLKENHPQLLQLGNISGTLTFKYPNFGGLTLQNLSLHSIRGPPELTLVRGKNLSDRNPRLSLDTCDGSSAGTEQLVSSG